MKFGDRIEYDLRRSHGEIGYGYLIGVPAYSRGLDDVVMLADDSYIGMPINAAHCKAIGINAPFAEVLRKRYDEKFPGALK